MTSSATLHPRRRPFRLLGVVLAVMALVAVSCSRDGEVVGGTGDDEVTRGDVFDEVDQDDDGVVAREDFDQALLLADPELIVAQFPGGEILMADVLASLEESPPSSLTPDTAPDRVQVVGRLTSMLRLRLSAVALTDLGFPVSLDASDAAISGVVNELVLGEFEQHAMDEAIADRPEILKLAAPHCLSLLAVPTEAELLEAIGRVEAGERIFDVAAEVNFENTTEVGGGLGCNDVLTWQQLIADTVEELGGLETTEFSSPSAVPVATSPTGELWLSIHVDDILIDLSDPASLGPFAGAPLTAQMQSYEIDIAEILGEWLPPSLSVSLPN